MATFFCSCGGTFGYTSYSLPFLRNWLTLHREHDTSVTELEISDELASAMGWPPELVADEIAHYNQLAKKYPGKVV